jgi:hypothetical protein
VTKYADLIKAHLAEYKRTSLGVSASGVWRRNGKPYAHILPEAQAELNILPQIRAAFWAFAQSRKLRLHTDFHHLASSQAFTFNLFYPFRDAPPAPRAALTESLGLTTTALTDIRFEAVVDPDEESNLDVVLDLATGEAVIEVKLTEAAFGAGRADQRHRQKRDDIYGPRLTGKVAPSALADDVFWPHYQLLRNLSYVDPAASRTVLLLLPRANTALRNDTETFLAAFLAPSLRNWVRIVFAEDLVADLKRAIAAPSWLVAHLGDVDAKYFPTVAV